jgi:type IV pilus assembly protein PilP
VRRRKVKRRRLDKKEGRGFRVVLGNPILCCLISVAFLFVAGCGGGSPTHSVPPKAKEGAAEKPKAQPAVADPKKDEEKKEAAEYTYDPAGKPDPFKPFIQLVPVKVATRNAPLTPLQRYEVSQLRLVAIISTPEGNTALVEDSTGKGFFLKKGTQVGRNDGKVSKVLKDKVIIEEQYQDVLGQTKQSEVTLNLYQTEEGGEP